MRCQKGFTLIELSIVLVIIGLIIGSVLAGKDLIRAAEVRKTISKIEEINTAAGTFRAKFSCMPGDCIRATTFFNNVTNGDGDAMLNTSENAYFAGTERAYFYDHLGSAAIVNLPPFEEADNSATIPGVGYPETPIGGGLIVFSSPGWTDTATEITVPGQYYYIGVTNVATPESWVNSVSASGSALIPSQTAFALDVKIDDGKPLDGIARAMIADDGEDGIFRYYQTPHATEGCVSNASGNPYSFPGTGCSLSIQAGF